MTFKNNTNKVFWVKIYIQEANIIEDNKVESFSKDEI